MVADSLPPDDELDSRAKSRLGVVLREKYTLERVLGVGGMASVYAATHRNGNQVALKLLHPELAFNSEIRGRFLREGHVANHVKHPGAVAVIDDDVTEDGWAFLVMELLEGVTVQDHWEARDLRLSPALVGSVLLQLLDVMVAAHAVGIIHRDLKPANLFLTPHGELKVLDFGIARMRDLSGMKTTNAGAVLGTPAFMAPEQAMARAKEIDGRTDVWAVGAVGFALLAGDIVHPAESPQETLVLAATRPARPLFEACPSVPVEIARVIDRALAFDKAARWSSAAEMHAALREACAAAFGEVPGHEVVRAALGAGPSPKPPMRVDSTLGLEQSPSTSLAPRRTVEGSMTLPGIAAPLVPLTAAATRTGDPVSSTAPPDAPQGLPDLPLRLWFRFGDPRRGLLLLGAALAGAVLVLRAGAPSASASVAAPRAIVAASAAADVAVAPTPALPPAQLAVLEPAPQPAAPGGGTAAGPSEAPTRTSRPADVRAPASMSSARPHPVSSGSTVPTPVPVSVVKTSSCAPPFVIEARTGRKIWKLECL